MAGKCVWTALILLVGVARGEQVQIAEDNVDVLQVAAPGHNDSGNQSTHEKSTVQKTVEHHSRKHSTESNHSTTHSANKTKSKLATAADFGFQLDVGLWGARCSNWWNDCMALVAGNPCGSFCGRCFRTDGIPKYAPEEQKAVCVGGAVGTETARARELVKGGLRDHHQRVKNWVDQKKYDQNRDYEHYQDLTKDQMTKAAQHKMRKYHARQDRRDSIREHYDAKAAAWQEARQEASNGHYGPRRRVHGL